MPRSLNEILDALQARGFSDDDLARIVDEMRMRHAVASQSEHVVDVPQDDVVAALETRVSSLEELVASILVKLDSSDSEQS